jgi:hypothetical protein
MTSVRSQDWLLLASIAAWAILAAPLWCVASPPMPDYPAHLASFYLISGGASHYYQVKWALLPNLAGEAIVPLLAKLLPLATATKLFLTITVGLWVLGPQAIQRALTGKFGLGGLIAAAFTYNATFLWGFFNYEFAVGLSFFVIAGWIATDGKRTALHLVGFSIAFTFIYCSHLFALATLMLMIASYETAKVWLGAAPSPRQLARRLALLAVLIAPSVLLFLLLKPLGGGVLQFNLADTMAERFEAAIQLRFDQPAYVVTGVLALLFLAGALTRRLHVAAKMGLGLVVLLVCTILAPEWALGGWGVHLRLPAVLGAMTLASCDLRLHRRWIAIGAAAALALFAYQAVTLALDWRKVDAHYSEFRAVEREIKPNARVVTVLDGDSLGWSSDQIYWHMPEFAVIDRGAFTPMAFTTPGQHIIDIRPDLRPYAAATAQQGSPPDVDELNDLAAGRKDADEDIRDTFPYLLYFQCHYDEAVVIRGAGPMSRVPPMLRLRHMGSFFALYDIKRDAHCAR